MYLSFALQHRTQFSDVLAYTHCVPIIALLHLAIYALYQENLLSIELEQLLNVSKDEVPLPDHTPW